ncbi:MAG: CBS domain-containing protein [Pseudomonadota bacterium]
MKNDPDHNEPDSMAEMELTDDDVLAAMQRISGYIDITTEDFRTIYHLAHSHALQRLLGNITAQNLIRDGIEPLIPEMSMDEAAQVFVRTGHKSLPVVDPQKRVIGMLTETDFLKHLKADSCLNLLLKLLDGSFAISEEFHQLQVRMLMTTPAVTINGKAGFKEIISAFRAHNGRSMPVVNDTYQLIGLLLRKDFIHAIGLEKL